MAATEPQKPRVDPELKRQRELTAEVKRTIEAHRQLGAVQLNLQRQVTAEIKRVLTSITTVAGEEPELERFRNPHDRIGEYDRLDRKEAIVMSTAHYMLYLPGLKQRMRFVPARAIAEYTEDDDGQLAFVECPCGGKPIAREMIEKCGDCERYYLLVRKGVLVIYGEMTPPWLPDAQEALALAGACRFGKCDGDGFVIDEESNTAYDCECRPRTPGA